MSAPSHPTSLLSPTLTHTHPHPPTLTQAINLGAWLRRRYQHELGFLPLQWKVGGWGGAYLVGGGGAEGRGWGGGGVVWTVEGRRVAGNERGKDSSDESFPSLPSLPAPLPVPCTPPLPSWPPPHLPGVRVDPPLPSLIWCTSCPAKQTKKKTKKTIEEARFTPPPPYHPLSRKAPCPCAPRACNAPSRPYRACSRACTPASRPPWWPTQA